LGDDRALLAYLSIAHHRAGITWRGFGQRLECWITGGKPMHYVWQMNDGRWLIDRTTSSKQPRLACEDYGYETKREAVDALARAVIESRTSASDE